MGQEQTNIEVHPNMRVKFDKIMQEERFGSDSQYAKNKRMHEALKKQ